MRIDVGQLIDNKKVICLEPNLKKVIIFEWKSNSKSYYIKENNTQRYSSFKEDSFFLPELSLQNRPNASSLAHMLKCHLSGHLYSSMYKDVPYPTMGDFFLRLHLHLHGYLSSGPCQHKKIINFILFFMGFR